MNNPDPYPCQACGSLQENAAWSSLFFLVLTVGAAWGGWKIVQYLDKD